MKNSCFIRRCLKIDICIFDQVLQVLKSKIMSNASFYKLLMLVTIITGMACQQTIPEDQVSLGDVDFTPTGKTEAQPFFQQGLLLLHSFEYDDAKAAFVQAQELDPDMVMAYWGEAMTHNHPVWHRQDKEAAAAALAKLAPTPEARLAKSTTPLETDLLEATEILFGAGDKLQRDSAYSVRMKDLYEKYPGQHEVAAFYALSLLGAVSGGPDYDAFGKSGQIAKSILAENPNHPGALHYAIHAYDDPKHAVNAITAANSYAKVAPDATHALHMPSHIYVVMGMWDEVISSNIASYAASVNRMKRLELDNDARSYHAFSWLLYGRLQKGEKAEADQQMNEMIAYTQTLPSKSARSYLLSMKGHYLVETEDWEGEFADIEIDISDLGIDEQAKHSLLEGVKAFRAKENDTLEALIKELEDKRQSASLQTSERGTPLCSGGYTQKLPSKRDIERARVMELELRGLYAQLINKPEMADQLLKEACELERSLDYDYGPGGIPYPAFDLYGEWLLEQGRAKEAMEQFNSSLARGENRVKALRGKLAAAEQLGDQEIIKDVNGLLNKISAGGVAI